MRMEYQIMTIILMLIALVVVISMLTGVVPDLNAAIQKVLGGK